MIVPWLPRDRRCRDQRDAGKSYSRDLNEDETRGLLSTPSSSPTTCVIDSTGRKSCSSVTPGAMPSGS